MTRLADALAWLAEDKSHGYRKASKLFGIPASEIKTARTAQRSIETPKSGNISFEEFTAWVTVNPLYSGPMDVVRDLRPDEEHIANGAEYKRVRRYMDRSPETTTVKVEPVDPTGDKRQWAVEQLSLAEADLANLRKKKNPSANGLAALQKSAREYRRIIDEDGAPTHDKWDDLTHEQRLEAVRDEAMSWPPEYLEVVLRVYGEQVRGDVTIHENGVFLVHEGGKAVLTEDGWEQVENE